MYLQIVPPDNYLLGVSGKHKYEFLLEYYKFDDYGFETTGLLFGSLSGLWTMCDD
jgi:hypothetical protein